MGSDLIRIFGTELRTDDRRIPPRAGPLDIRALDPLGDRRFSSQLAELDALRRGTQPGDAPGYLPPMHKPDTGLYKQGKVYRGI